MYIDPKITSLVAENGKKNILVLGLSTFSLQKQNIDGVIRDVLTKSTMSAEEEIGVKIEQEYYYQLEPVPIMLFSKLGKKIDLVIEIGTTQTERKREIYLQTIGEMNISPREFFEKRLGDKVVEFRPFLIDNGIEDTTPQTIIEVVRLLQKMKGEGDYNLWIDNHGGLRNSQMVLQCILSLLKKDGIQPQETYMLEYSNGKGVVKVAKQANSINEFVSGVNEFLSFGRTQSLQKYFAMNHEKSELPDKIQNIADAIQLCNIEQFERALDSMQKWIGKNQDYYKNNYQELFVEYLQSDYGDLLSKEKRTTLKEIEWCMGKDFIQQALTLVESKMPGDVIKHGYLTYDPEKRVKRFDGSEILLGAAIEESKKMIKKGWESSDNYVLEQFCHENSIDKNRYHNLRHVDNILVDTTEKSPVSICDGTIKIELGLPTEQKKLTLLYEFLALHVSLKNQRNLICHANGTDNNRVPAPTLVAAINKYIVLAKKLGIV